MRTLIVPILALGLTCTGSVLAFLFGAGKAVAVLLGALVVVGVALSLGSPDHFQTYLMFVGYGSLIVVGSVAIGVGIGASLRNKRHVTAALLFTPMAYVLWSAYTIDARQVDEAKLALEYFMKNQQVVDLVGPPVKVYPVSSITYSRKDRSRYEYTVRDKPGLYFIVDVSRERGVPKFSLACVTSVPLGRRDSQKDVCEQSPIPLTK